jgi:DNA-binding response OmpR family regulator
MESLIASPYNRIISDVHLAEMHYFSLLKHHEILQKPVPVVVTPASSDTQAARRALEYGAFDIIPRPLLSAQATTTIRLALWQNKLMSIIAGKEKATERYRQHFAVYPADKKMKQTFRKSLLLVQRTITSYPKTIQQIEETIMCFNHVAGMVGKEARERALKRLHALSPDSHRPTVEPGLAGVGCGNAFLDRGSRLPCR